MTSVLALTVLLSTQTQGHGPDPLASARQAMLGEARLPWVLHVTGSIARSDRDAAERFVLEWEPRQRRDVRGYRSSAADTMLQAAESLVCGPGAIKDVRVEQNGTRIRYAWERTDSFGGLRFALDVDPRTGLVSRSRVDQWSTFGPPDRRGSRTITAELSDFRPVGRMRLPHRIRVAARNLTEHWTIERIEIVPLP
jgi:hypothetical protein